MYAWLLSFKNRKSKSGKGIFVYRFIFSSVGKKYPCSPSWQSCWGHQPPQVTDIKSTYLHWSAILQNLILTNISCGAVHHAEFYFLFVMLLLKLGSEISWDTQHFIFPGIKRLYGLYNYLLWHFGLSMNVLFLQTHIYAKRSLVEYEKQCCWTVMHYRWRGSI